MTNGFKMTMLFVLAIAIAQLKLARCRHRSLLPRSFTFYLGNPFARLLARNKLASIITHGTQSRQR
jgi:hypothetical protein